MRHNKVFGYYIEISKGQAAAAPPEYERRQTLVGAERFITPELKEYEQKIFGAQERSTAMEFELFCEIREKVVAQTALIQETADALACRISYGRDDLTLIDWNAAILFDRDAEDVRAVLEFANVELLELRCLDRQLDGSLDRSYELTLRQSRLWRFVPGRVARHLRRISRMQLDGAILFERVSNAPKLLGDQFLARVYRLAAQRFHLNEWSTGVLRKLDTIEDFYRQLSDSASGVRLEMLEWIIILLIVIEIVMPLIPGLLPRS